MSLVWQGKIDRQRAFWKRENRDRPVIGVTGTYFSTGVTRSIQRAEGRVRPEDIVVDRVLEDNDRQFEMWSECTGDLFWTASPLYQFRWLAAAVGAPVFVGGDSIWAEPFIEDYSALDDLRISQENAWVQKLWELTDALTSHAAGRYPVAANEFMPPLSALADLRGNTEFAFDLYDRPEDVARGMERFTANWSALILAQYERLPAWYGGYTGAQRYIWAPGRTAEFNEDPVFMFSPDFHKRFVLPSHRQVVRQIEYAYIHLHSTQLHTLDPLLDMEELRAIEITPDYGESIRDLLPAIARVQARKPVIVHAFLTAEEMEMIIDNVPPEGLCIISRAESSEDARRLQDAILG
jgi:hypothetical protein